MYQCCLKRKKSSALDVESEDLPIGILSEPEWVFVFERVGAIGRKVKYGMTVKGAASRAAKWAESAGTLSRLWILTWT